MGIRKTIRKSKNDEVLIDLIGEKHIYRLKKGFSDEYINYNWDACSINMDNLYIKFKRDKDLIDIHDFFNSHKKPGLYKLKIV